MMTEYGLFPEIRIDLDGLRVYWLPREGAMVARDMTQHELLQFGFTITRNNGDQSRQERT
jgi:hypothetical protein